MKYLSIIGMLMLMGVASHAMASCGTAYPILGVEGDVSGKRVLATALGGEQWHEDHCASGDLYKVGAGTAVDPYAYRGMWSYSSIVVGGVTIGQVMYNYTVGGTNSYTWRLWNDGSGGLCWDDGSSIIAEGSATGSAGSCGL